MTMLEDLLALYNGCCPNFQTTETWFQSLLKPDKAHIIEKRDAGGNLLGYALVHGGTIALLCVGEGHRGQGIGSELLGQAEDHIKKRGHERAILGNGPLSVLQGVPYGQDGRAVAFFKRHGYKAQRDSVFMRLMFDGFDVDSLPIPNPPESVIFRLAEPKDQAALLPAVQAVEPGWVDIFRTCEDPILLAVEGDALLGFEILSLDAGRFLPIEGMGCIGCVGTVPAARRRGIGLAMVAQGAAWLKKQGQAGTELLFVELVDWYAKIGFTVAGRQWMGEKAL